MSDSDAIVLIGWIAALAGGFSGKGFADAAYRVAVVVLLLGTAFEVTAHA